MKKMRRLSANELVGICRAVTDELADNWRRHLVPSHARALLVGQCAYAIELEAKANGWERPTVAAVRERMRLCGFTIGLVIMMAVVSWLIQRLLDRWFPDV